MRSTAELRILWAPACTAPFARLNLYGEGVVTVDVLIVDAVKALNAVLIDWDYRTRRADTGAYNCRQITGGTSYSLHAYGIAVDLNWNTNPYGRTLVTDMAIGMIEAIEGIRTAGGVQVWRWGGRYSNNKDAMHFEVVASPAELARGIQSQTTTNTERLIVTPEDERKIQAMLDTQGNRIIEFLTAVIADNFATSLNKVAKWTKAMSDLTVD
ncbi:MAG: M15 family metallopeptidase, partial [Candidatus Microthrix parvicella]